MEGPPNTRYRNKNHEWFSDGKNVLYHSKLRTCKKLIRIFLNKIGILGYIKKKYSLFLYLIGKSVTYDAGGLNLKLHDIEHMKIDMVGSAIILSVLNLLNATNIDINYNINVLFPVVENMINNSATKPGSVIKTMNNN